jgi:hypothetical protein
MHVYTQERESDALDLDRLLGEIAGLSGPELERVEEALKSRRCELAQSGVLERRGYADGVLQLEWRGSAGGEKRWGPYWYFYWREGGKQRSMYVGKTDDPEAVVEQKLLHRRGDAAADESGS